MTHTKITNRLFIIISILITSLLFAQSGSISGTVTDEDGNALGGANIMVQGTNLGNSSSSDGSYSISNVPEGPQTIEASFIGYESSISTVDVTSGNVEVSFSLSVSSLATDEVVVSATRGRPMKIVDAPVTISVLNEDDIRRDTGFSFVNSFKKVKGVDTYQTGIDGVAINARGFMTSYSYRFQLRADGMNSMLPGAGISPQGMLPVMKEDIARMEAIVGPSSALYGPNAHNGMLNVISKHPKDSQGGTVVLGAGQNSIMNVRARYAGEAGPIAYKVNLEKLSGEDWKLERNYWIDGNGDGVMDEGEYTVEGNETDVDYLKYNASAYYGLGSNLELSAGYGSATTSNLQTTNVGHLQVKNWVVSNWFAQVTGSNFFARVYGMKNTTGETYQLETRALYQLTTGASKEEAVKARNLIDDSNRLNAEAQFNTSFGSMDVIAGVDYEKSSPVSGRTYLDDSGTDPFSGEEVSKDIVISQFGAYGQVEAGLPMDLSLTAAFRYDQHDLFDPQTSPRLALTWKGLGNGAIRATWNRAFQSPAILQQYLYIYYGMHPLGLPIFLMGNNSGFTTADGTEIPRLSPEVNETMEFGYKGTPLKGLYVDVNYYQSHYENFISALQTFVMPSAKGGEALDPAIVLSYMNFGEVDINGFDLGIDYQVSDMIGVFANYSKVDDSDLDNKKDYAVSDSATVAEYSGLMFNTPEGKWYAGVRLSNVVDGLEISVSAHHVDQFDYVSGYHFATEAYEGLDPTGNPYFHDYGPLGDFTTIDISASYQINDSMGINLNVSNVTDVEARQMAGSPATRRLAVAEFRYTF